MSKATGFLLLVFALFACREDVEPCPVDAGFDTLEADGGAGLYRQPTRRDSCQYNHPTPYAPCSDDEGCEVCEYVSRAFHNRASELGCCLPFTCSYRPGVTERASVAALFESKNGCVALQLAAREVADL